MTADFVAISKRKDQPSIIPGTIEHTNGSRLFRYLFYAFCIYLVLPIIDVPLLGLSLSAPIFFIIALEVIFRISKDRFSFGDFPAINIFVYLFLFGVFASIALNVISGNYTLDTSNITSVIRFGYWLLVFYITSIIISKLSLQNVLTYIIGASLALLTILRLYEAVFLGKWGAWTGPNFLTQNTYGILFSTFTPYLFTLIFITKSRRLRVLFFLLLIATIIAIIGNGSRSNWVAGSIAIVINTVFIMLIQKNFISGLIKIAITVVICVGLVLLIMPEASWQPVIDRFLTFEQIEEDKSFAARQLMVQKGLKLFEESPIFGVGVGRFTSESVELSFDGLPLLRDQEKYNRKSSHNSYVSFLGETGLLGTLPLVVLLLYLAIKGGLSAIRLTRQNELWTIPVYASFIGMSIHLWTLSGLTGTVTWFVYGIVAGMIIYATQNTQQDKPLI